MNACSHIFFSGSPFRIKEDRGWWNPRQFSFIRSKYPNLLIWKSRFGIKFGFVHRTATTFRDWGTSLGTSLPPEPLYSQFLHYFVGKRQRYVTTYCHKESRYDYNSAWFFQWKGDRWRGIRWLLMGTMMRFNAPQILFSFFVVHPRLEY